MRLTAENLRQNRIEFIKVHKGSGHISVGYMRWTKAGVWCKAMNSDSPYQITQAFAATLGRTRGLFLERMNLVNHFDEKSLEVTAITFNQEQEPKKVSMKLKVYLDNNMEPVTISLPSMRVPPADTDPSRWSEWDLSAPQQALIEDLEYQATCFVLGERATKQTDMFSASIQQEISEQAATAAMTVLKGRA